MRCGGQASRPRSLLIEATVGGRPLGRRPQPFAGRTHDHERTRGAGQARCLHPDGLPQGRSGRSLRRPPDRQGRKPQRPRRRLSALRQPTLRRPAHDRAFGIRGQPSRSSTDEASARPAPSSSPTHSGARRRLHQSASPSACGCRRPRQALRSRSKWTTRRSRTPLPAPSCCIGNAVFANRSPRGGTRLRVARKRAVSVSRARRVRRPPRWGWRRGGVSEVLGAVRRGRARRRCRRRAGGWLGAGRRCAGRRCRQRRRGCRRAARGRVFGAARGGRG
jgi:hypothetical protein